MIDLRLLAWAGAIACLSGCAGTAAMNGPMSGQQCRVSVNRHGERLRICETDERVTVEDVGRPAPVATAGDHPPPPRLLDNAMALIDALPRLPRRRLPLGQRFAERGRTGYDDRIIIAISVRQLAELLASR